MNLLQVWDSVAKKRHPALAVVLDLRRVCNFFPSRKVWLVICSGHVLRSLWHPSSELRSVAPCAGSKKKVSMQLSGPSAGCYIQNARCFCNMLGWNMGKRLLYMATKHCIESKMEPENWCLKGFWLTIYFLFWDPCCLAGAIPVCWWGYIRHTPRKTNGWNAKKLLQKVAFEPASPFSPGGICRGSSRYLCIRKMFASTIHHWTPKNRGFGMRRRLMRIGIAVRTWYFFAPWQFRAIRFCQVEHIVLLHLWLGWPATWFQPHLIGACRALSHFLPFAGINPLRAMVVWQKGCWVATLCAADLCIRPL